MLRPLTRARATRMSGARLFAAASLFLARPAYAAETLGVESSVSVPPAPAGTEQAVVARYWELGRVRSFVAANVETGYFYLRPRFMAGYGRPFWSWLGVEAYPLLSLGGVGHYSGIAGSVPGLTLRAGTRYFYPFSRTFLPEKERYTRTDLESREGPTADYLAFEGELTGTTSLFRGSAFVVLTGYRTALVPENYALFEESLRTVMDPPYILRARLGYLLALGRGGAIRVGAASDAIWLPGRSELVIRGGVLGSVLISPHLEAQASFIPVLVSPDNLGLVAGDFGQLGVRYSWASGSAIGAPRASTPDAREPNPDPAR